MAQRNPRSTWAPRPGTISIIASIPLLLIACGGGAFKPREACLLLEATPSVNLYDGQAHAINVFIYPLTGPAAFQDASIEDLVAGRGIEGAAGPAISVMLNPSEVRDLRESFPPTTLSIGVVANYYQAGLDTPGNRRALLEGKCSLFGSDKITLTARDLLVD